MWFLIAAILVVAVACAPEKDSNIILSSPSTDELLTSESGPFNVGLKIVDFEYSYPDGKKETLSAAIWYPTEEQPRPYIYHTTEDYKSSIAPDASVASKDRPFPLIIFAHGAYGSGYNSAFFMEYLASHGYIVIAPDFLDTKPPDYQEQIAFSRIKGGNVGQPLKILRIVNQFVRDMSNDRTLFLTYLAEHRLNHTSFIIDVMLALNRNANSIFYHSIIEETIGICGHSLGGTTALGKIGAYPDKKFQDKRIKAALIFSAPAYPFESTSSNIDVPIMIMAGDDDEPALHPGLPRRTIYDKARPPKYYLVLDNATHLSFGNTSCGQIALNQAVESNPQVNTICRYGLAFFEKHLLGNQDAGRWLENSNPAWAYYIREEKAGQSFEWGTEPPPGEGGPGGIGKDLWEGKGEW